MQKLHGSILCIRVKLTRRSVFCTVCIHSINVHAAIRMPQQRHVSAVLKPAGALIDEMNSCGKGPSLVIQAAMWAVQNRIMHLLH